MARAARAEGQGNPFDVGLWRNCTDFWSRGRTLGIESYTTLYEIPPGGFKSVLARKAEQRHEKRTPGAPSSARGSYAMVPTAEDA